MWYCLGGSTSYTLTFVVPSSVGLPPHSTACPAQLRLRVGPRALRRKKPLFREQGVKNFVRQSVSPERSKGEEAWGEKVGNNKIG